MHAERPFERAENSDPPVRAPALLRIARVEASPPVSGNPQAPSAADGRLSRYRSLQHRDLSAVVEAVLHNAVEQIIEVILPAGHSLSQPFVVESFDRRG